MLFCQPALNKLINFYRLIKWSIWESVTQEGKRLLCFYSSFDQTFSISLFLAWWWKFAKEDETTHPYRLIKNWTMKIWSLHILYQCSKLIIATANWLKQNYWYFSIICKMPWPAFSTPYENGWRQMSIKNNITVLLPISPYFWEIDIWNARIVYRSVVTSIMLMCTGSQLYCIPDRSY